LGEQFDNFKSLQLLDMDSYEIEKSWQHGGLGLGEGRAYISLEDEEEEEDLEYLNYMDYNDLSGLFKLENGETVSPDPAFQPPRYAPWCESEEFNGWSYIKADCWDSDNMYNPILYDKWHRRTVLTKNRRYLVHIQRKPSLQFYSLRGRTPYPFWNLRDYDFHCIHN